MMPKSSRVKKVIKWNTKLGKFELDEQDKADLQQYNITNEEQWREFEAFYEEFPAVDHPQVKRTSCCKKFWFYLVAFIILLAVAYVFFIILQLALFNLIMLVVMIVWWIKMFNICRAIINRMLDNGRKSAFKAHIRRMKDLPWLKELNIEIQENDEGRWIEVHLNELADDVDDNGDEDAE